MIEYLEEAWDLALDSWDYFSSFEWFGDTWEFITEMFTDLNEFSYMGLTFAILVLVFIYFTSPYMLKPFTDHMSPATSLFWTVTTYGASAVIGYMVGKRLWDN